MPLPTLRLPVVLILLVTLLSACMSARDIGDAGVERQAGRVHLAEIRSANDLPPLRPDRALERAALEQARLMAQSGRMEHKTGWRRDFATRMARNGIEGPAAENLAYGRMATERLFAMWLASPGHRRNMLDERYGRFGLAYASAASGGERYWALVLAR